MTGRLLSIDALHKECGFHFLCKAFMPMYALGA